MASILRILEATWPPVLLASLAYLLSFVLPFWWSLLPFTAFVVLCMDARARYKEYKQLCMTIPYGGTHSRLTAKMRTSWCGRTALLAAVRHTTNAEYTRTYRKGLHNCGYRWWHILPKGTFTRNTPFLKVSFWKSVVGVK